SRARIFIPPLLTNIASSRDDHLLTFFFSSRRRHTRVSRDWSSDVCSSDLYYVVTGAAGFIGSNLVRALNERGISNIIAVDNLTRADKFRNLVDCEIADYFDKEDFIDRVRAGIFEGTFEAVLHQGACSDTMEADGHY